MTLNEHNFEINLEISKLCANAQIGIANKCKFWHCVNNFITFYERSGASLHLGSKISPYNFLSVITDRILQYVTTHIEDNAPPKQKPAGGKREANEKQLVDRKCNNLVCSHRCIPLKFVNCTNVSGFEESIDQFRTLLMQHGNFGNQNKVWFFLDASNLCVGNF